MLASCKSGGYSTTGGISRRISVRSITCRGVRRSLFLPPNFSHSPTDARASQESCKPELLSRNPENGATCANMMQRSCKEIDPNCLRIRSYET